MGDIDSNESIIVISHEKYIRQVYKDTKIAYYLNKKLFAIEEPFKASENSTFTLRPQRSLNYIKKRNKKFNKLQNSIDEYCIPAKIFKLNEENISKCFQSIKSAKDISESVQNNFLNSSLQQLNEGINNAARTCIPNLCALDTVASLQESAIINFDYFKGSNLFHHYVIRNYKEIDFLFPPNCSFICNDILSCSLEERFDVIVIDPPWKNKAIRRKNRKKLPKIENSQSGKASTKVFGYSIMTSDDIEQVPINEWLDVNGIVLVWCTNSSEHQESCLKFFKKWNVVYMTKWYWLKVTTHGKPILPFTKEALHIKQPYEVIMIGARGAVLSNWGVHMKEKMIVSVPSALHSHKPPLVDVLKHVFNGCLSNFKGLEVFARYLLPGWTSIGNEVLKLQNVCFFDVEKE